MQIMCCFLLHDILKMKFEDLNLMRCFAKSNKYYQYICKIVKYICKLAALSAPPQSNLTDPILPMYW